MNLMMLFQQQLKLLGSFGCRMENMADAMQKMARGLVHPVIDTEVGFDDIDTALKRMEGRDPRMNLKFKLALFRWGQKLKTFNYWLSAHAIFGVLFLLRLLPAKAATNFIDASARRIGPLMGRHRV
eukprot:gene29196-35681_t